MFREVDFLVKVKMNILAFKELKELELNLSAHIKEEREAQQTAVILPHFEQSLLCALGELSPLLCSSLTWLQMVSKLRTDYKTTPTFPVREQSAATNISFM